MYCHDMKCCDGHSRRQIITADLLLATGFFYDCLKMSNAEDVSSALTRQSLGFITTGKLSVVK